MKTLLFAILAAVTYLPAVGQTLPYTPPPSSIFYSVSGVPTSFLSTSTTPVPFAPQPILVTCLNSSGQAVVATLTSPCIAGSGGGGGGATFTPGGLQFATSTTAARLALPADISNLITPQTGCSTAGFVWVPASNTCVAQSGGVTSFNARTGVIVPVAGDYSFSLISGVATPSQLPAATSSTEGIIKPDGTSCTVTSGILTCGAGSVTTTGSPASGNMTKFSGSSSITNAIPGTDFLSGVDGSTLHQTSGVASVVNSPAIDGVTVTGTPSAGQVPIASGPTTAVWGTGLAENFTPNQNATYLSPNCGSALNCSFVNDDGKMDIYATWTVSSSTITTSNFAPVFLPTDCTGGSGCTGTTNKKMFGTGDCNQFVQCQIQFSVGTISSYIGPHSVTVSTTSTTACTGVPSSVNPGNPTECFFVWGTDDTANIIAAFNSALAFNGQLQLPCGLMLIDAPVFINNTQHPNYPIGIQGCGSSASSVLIPTPDFAYSTATPAVNIFYDAFAGAQNVSTNAPNVLENFYIFGAGADNPINVVANSSAINLVQAYVKNVWVTAWVWNQPQFSGYALGGVTQLYGSGGNGVGTACTVYANSTNVGNFFSGDSFCGLGDFALNITGGTATSFGDQWFGPVNVAGTNSAFYSYGDYLESPITISGTGNYALLHGLTCETLTNCGISVGPGAVVDIDSADIPAQNGIALFMTGGRANLINSKMSNSSSSLPAIDMASGSPILNDEGGNTFTASGFTSTIANTSGSIVSQNMLQGSCTGLATPATTLFLYGMGSATLTTCTNATLQGGRVMSKPGTLTNLTCSAGTAGLTSDTCTVVKNGTPSALTCTFASSTCQDTTTAHYVSYNTGDIIAIQITTGLADTVANVTAQVWAQ